MLEKFHEYLYGSNFDINIDINPLIYTLMMAKLDAVSHCWVGSLANYNFQLHYRVGKMNIDLDALLRVSWPKCATNTMGKVGEVILRMQDGTLGQFLIKLTDPVEIKQLLHECNYLKLRKGILYCKVLPRESMEALFQLVLPTVYRETTLRGCHDDSAHLGLKEC